MTSPRDSESSTKELLLPLVLTAVIVILDQVTKAIIVATVPRIEYTGEMIRVIGDFLRIIHTRNLAVAFSLGRGLAEPVRRILFTILPLLVLAGLIVFYLRDKTLTTLQRWAIGGILGGGLGNLIDRVFRTDGVVDFVDVRFYGIFGMERWPTFNVADATVVVCGILLVITSLFHPQETSNEDLNEQKD